MSERVITDAQMDQISEALIGQCMAGEDDICSELGLPLSEEWTAADHAALDERCFCCSECSWWCESGELSDDPDELKCIDCAEES